MWFGVNWNDGYEVGVTMVNELGYYRYHPLRNFGNHQGDAKLFMEVDCPKLTDLELKLLINNYDPKVKYYRVNGKQFKKERK